MTLTELGTARLRLRHWKPADLPAFAALNADPRVMAYFPKRLSRDASDALADRCQALVEENTWGFWAVELCSSGEFIGMVGLHRPTERLPFSPCVEIGWRLRYDHWGKGYASEAARCPLQFAFESLALNEVVAFTAVGNGRSRAVMERLGMVNTRQNFLHPDLPEGHPLSEHVLYKVTREAWRASRG